MRGSSPKIILGDPRQSENAQTHTYKHTIPYMKFKLKLLHFKCHVLEFYNKRGSSKRLIREITRSLCGSDASHHQVHPPHPRDECTSSDALCLRVSAGNPTLISLGLPLTAFVSIIGRRKILTCT
jgi:hypothetical protein